MENFIPGNNSCDLYIPRILSNISGCDIAILVQTTTLQCDGGCAKTILAHPQVAFFLHSAAAQIWQSTTWLPTLWTVSFLLPRKILAALTHNGETCLGWTFRPWCERQCLWRALGKDRQEQIECKYSHGDDCKCTFKTCLHCCQRNSLLMWLGTSARKIYFWRRYTHTWYLSFLLHRQHFQIPNFTPKNWLETP